MRVKTETEGKTKDVDVTKVTPENYIVPDNEKHLYHCVIEVRKFDSETGKRLSVPRVQKFGKKMYENNIADNLKKQGYTITVLHDPNEWLADQAEANKAKAQAAAEKAAADAKAKEEADAKAKAEEKAALKAEILAELKAAGVIPAEPAKETKADAKAKAEAEDKPGAKK